MKVEEWRNKTKKLTENNLWNKLCWLYKSKRIKDYDWSYD